MNFVTKIIKATFKSNSGIAALPPITTPIAHIDMPALGHDEQTYATQ
jgi:phage tail protein X